MLNTTKKRIAIASDHAGYALKGKIKQFLQEHDDYDVFDLGTHTDVSVDYPEFGFRAAQAICENEADQAIVICGSGIGIAMAANRFIPVRAAPCISTEMARLARAHNDANVLAIGARLVDEATAFAILEMFLKTDFEGGRHERRVAMLSPLDDEDEETSGHCGHGCGCH